VLDIDSGGTALNDAVSVGIDVTTLAEQQRAALTGNALTFGTLVVITDGENESGAQMLNTTKVGNTSVSIVSMGISRDVTDSVLSAIGKDGSFLAPDPEEWGASLSEIASRILERPETIYQVAYCSPSTEGNHTLEVAFGADSTPVECDFAGVSDGLSSVACADFIENECTATVAGAGDAGTATPECGGFTACPYTCENDEVCDERLCVPMTVPDGGI
jgi:hypothetical protein